MFFMAMMTSAAILIGAIMDFFDGMGFRSK